MFEHIPPQLTVEERRQHAALLTDVVVASDAFFPFSDNIYRAHLSGVKYVAAPNGSVQDQVVIEAADECEMVLCHTNLRLFHH